MLTTLKYLPTYLPTYPPTCLPTLRTLRTYLTFLNYLQASSADDAEATARAQEGWPLPWLPTRNLTNGDSASIQASDALAYKRRYRK